MDAYSILVNELTKPWQGQKGIYSKLERFAHNLGWYPSDIIIEKANDSFVCGHLFVEHGLENSAVISFLNNTNSFESLSQNNRNDLLKISYNNLVDLHIPLGDRRVCGVNNLLANGGILYAGNITQDVSNLRSEFFEDINHNSASMTYKSLDDALIDTIKKWRGAISAETFNSLEEENLVLSNFFNAIIFVRAVEDQFKKLHLLDIQRAEPFLISEFYRSASDAKLSIIIQNTLSRCDVKEWPSSIIDIDMLDYVGTKLSRYTFPTLFNDFYINSYAPYVYDFAIMSKHALSRIYEQYVSILRVEEPTGQTSLFGQVPKQVNNRNSGTYYTPQYIARFFARYTEKIFPTIRYKALKIIEPAVGSGIFLRTLLEVKSEGVDDVQLIKSSFNNIVGLDRESTACNAARLSLALLHLSLTNELPAGVNIINADSLPYFGFSNEHNDTADVVVANPPFVPYDSLGAEERNLLSQYLSDQKYGKADLYLAFIKIALQCLKPGGIGLFVLPGAFLYTKSALGIRKLLSKNTSIKCLVDLSEIAVFGDVKAYPILLVFQKHDDKNLEGNSDSAVIAKVQRKVGRALYDTIRGRIHEGEDYSIFELPQSFFLKEEWTLSAPSEFYLQEKLKLLPTLDSYLEARTGFTAGSPHFLLERSLIPKGESKVFAPLLSDREIKAFVLPSKTKEVFFYPYIDNELITEEQLRKSFPKTYEFLSNYRKDLENRPDVKKGTLPWWRPMRPRTPAKMLVPKIVTPHLVFTPKFSFDSKGEYTIARAPYLVLSNAYTSDDTNLELQQELMLYFTAVLNSRVCFWYLFSITPQYSRGYAMLEPKYLNSIPIPDPFKIPRRVFANLVSLVKERIALQDKSEGVFVQKKIEEIVTGLYGLTDEERRYLNILS
jgi:type I restriction-modification system DNA methylase subunit